MSRLIDPVRRALTRPARLTVISAAAAMLVFGAAAPAVASAALASPAESTTLAAADPSGVSEGDKCQRVVTKRDSQGRVVSYTGCASDRKRPDFSSSSRPKTASRQH